MLIVTTIGPGVVPYFIDGRDRGRWTPAAGALLGLEGAVDAADLRLVLQGRHPDDGRFLPATRPPRRRGGWDLMFSASKSVSLLALEDASVGADHQSSVAAVLDHAESRLVMVRHSPDGRPVAAAGLVGACFEHASNAAGEPHLHSHVLIANLSRGDDGWGPVQGRDWYVGRRALAALYQLDLRHRMTVRDPGRAWRLRPDGLADEASVPRPVVRAASSQSLAASAGDRFAVRRAGVIPGDWRDRVTDAGGWSRPGRSAAPAEREALPACRGLSDGTVERAVEIRLSAQRSDFRFEDVVVALAATCPDGAPVTEAVSWAEDFAAACSPVRSPTAGRRWATAPALRADRDLAEALRAREATATASAPDRSPVAQVAGRRRGVVFLTARPGTTELLGQAELLEECGRVWAAEGRAVAVDSPTAAGALRWRVLTGIEPHRPGTRPDVLVIDQADRRPSSELAGLLQGCAGLVVCVEGGTLPRLTNPASHGLATVGDELGRLQTGPHRDWAAGAPGEGVPWGRDAAERLLHQRQAAPTGTLLVGLGPEEVHALNRAAAPDEGRAPTGAGRFRPGDPVVVLRGGRGGLPGYGTLGTATEGTTSRWLDVEWADGTRIRTADGRVAARVGLAHAMTPHLAARTDRPLLVLGPASVMARSRDRGRIVASLDLDGRERGRERAWGLEPGR